MAVGWPATLAHGDVLLRPLKRSDAAAWVAVRQRNAGWLEHWEGAPPGAHQLSWDERHSTTVFHQMRRAQQREAKAGRSLPFTVTYAGDLVGQATVSNIVRGAFHSASIGYWVDERVAGRGITPTAVSLAVDHAMRTCGLHRIEVNIRPENAPSIRVVEKLGFRYEARHQKFLFIDGAWRDHLSFAYTAEDLPGGLLREWDARVQEAQRDTPPDLHDQ
jgi:ribosomal-protein-alanine N-acetyltransferase